VLAPFRSTIWLVVPLRSGRWPLLEASAECLFRFRQLRRDPPARGRPFDCVPTMRTIDRFRLFAPGSAWTGLLYAESLAALLAMFDFRIHNNSCKGRLSGRPLSFEYDARGNARAQKGPAIRDGRPSNLRALSSLTSTWLPSWVCLCCGRCPTGQRVAGPEYFSATSGRRGQMPCPLQFRVASWVVHRASAGEVPLLSGRRRARLTRR
jgi:hypothetical protein